MAYVYTGTKRSLTFNLVKTVGGVVQQGYSPNGKPYDGRLAFPGYAAITDIEAARLTTNQYNTRLAAFLAYVESIEAGFEADIDMTNAPTDSNQATADYTGAYCVPPPTTTTTTTA